MAAMVWLVEVGLQLARQDHDAAALFGFQTERHLSACADDGFPCYPLFENDRMFSGLRNNDRFITLMTQLKRQWERYNATL